MDGSGLDQIDGFKKFCESGLDRIQLLRIRIGLGLKNFTVWSSLMSTQVYLKRDKEDVQVECTTCPMQCPVGLFLLCTAY